MPTWNELLPELLPVEVLFGIGAEAVTVNCQVQLHKITGEWHKRHNLSEDYVMLSDALAGWDMRWPDDLSADDAAHAAEVTGGDPPEPGSVMSTQAEIINMLPQPIISHLLSVCMGAVRQSAAAGNSTR